MADLTQIEVEIVTIEMLAASRARLKHIEAGKPLDPIFGPDYEARLRQEIADLEAQVAAFPKD